MTQDGLWLRWEDVVYDVPLPDAKGDAPTSKRILHGVSGQVLPGGLVAVMGASGSGKTSLLKLLAGRRQASSGVVLVNGAVMDTATYRRASGFVAQTSVFLDTLTVRALRACCVCGLEWLVATVAACGLVDHHGRAPSWARH
jgi:ABC-type transport system involved in cytochrome bd biosynthesis fused ATPase/permease subunit